MNDLLDYKDIWTYELSDEQRLAATLIVFEKINEHMEHGGTYRYLIYDRLGFDPDAYSVLYPEGMNISNMCHDYKILMSRTREEIENLLGDLLDCRDEEWKTYGNEEECNQNTREAFEKVVETFLPGGYV
jgi:hypothetical protein